MIYINKIKLLIVFSTFISFSFSQKDDYNYSNSDEFHFRYKEICIGGNYSNYSHYHEVAKSIPTNSINLIISSNGPPSSSPIYNYIYPEIYSHNVFSIGSSLSEYFNFGDNLRFFYKTFLSVGKDIDNDPNHLDNSKTNNFINLFEINLLGGVDINWIGLETGTHFGNLRRWDGMNGDEDGTLSYGKPNSILHFCGKLRLGRVKILFFESRLGNPYFGLNGSKYPYTVGLGSGLGKDNGNVLRASVGLAGQKSLVFITGFKLKIYKNFGVETDVCFGTSTFVYLTVFKRLAKKEIKMKI